VRALLRGSPDGRVPAPVFLGAVVASIGGPLGLVALYVPGAAGDALPAAGLTTVLALVVFLAPLAIWLGFSRRVASAGGLAAFVEAAAGPKLARLQALIWIVSYFLYLPYTVTYIVYDLLAPIFPGIVPYRGWLEVLLPIGIALFALAPLAASLAVLALVAAAQLVVVAVLGGLLYFHSGASSSAFTAHVGAAPLGRGVGGVALLFICASLPLFFAAEVRGGSRTVRRGLAAGYGIVGVFLLFAAVPLSLVAEHIAGTDLPGVLIAQVYSGRPLAVAVALVSAASVAALIALELLALGRLVHWLAGSAIRPTLAAIAVPFVAADAFSLIDPERFYSDLLKPSLIALFASQLFVFLVYPLFRRREQARLPVAVAASAIASALAGYGLYMAIHSSVGT
jgi:amino acid transporter